MAVSRFCSQSGEGPFLTPRTSRRPKAGHKGGASIVTLTGQGKVPFDRLYRAVLEGADGGRAEIAGDAVDAGAVRPVGREIDFDHRLAERRPIRRKLLPTGASAGRSMMPS